MEVDKKEKDRELQIHYSLCESLYDSVNKESEDYLCEIGVSLYELKKYKEKQVKILAQIQFATGQVLAKQNIEIKILKRLMIFIIAISPFIFVSTHYIIKYLLEYLIK